jgi:zinc transport system substrate-binding protein
MIFRLLILGILLIPLFSCSQKESPKQESIPTVLVSVPPYAFFVEQIAKNTVQIETLVPAGANPHIYEASPQEVQRHHRAALWIYLGESFDKKVLKYFQETRHPIQILDITQGIDLLSLCEEHGWIEETHHSCPSQHEGYDLHIWLSPTRAKAQAQKITSALIALLPEHKQEFMANLQVFEQKLDELNHQLTHILKPVKGKAILVSHPAFGYFCQDYHLTQLSIEFEGKEPLPQHITKILQQAKQYSIQSVLIEPQYSNKGAELLAQSLHLPTHLVDPYSQNYLDNLLSIAKVIAE